MLQSLLAENFLRETSIGNRGSRRERSAMKETLNASTGGGVISSILSPVLEKFYLAVWVKSWSMRLHSFSSCKCEGARFDVENAVVITDSQWHCIKRFERLGEPVNGCPGLLLTFVGRGEPNQRTLAQSTCCGWMVSWFHRLRKH